MVVYVVNMNCRTVILLARFNVANDHEQHRTKTTENLDDEELHAKGKTFAPPRDLPFSISGQRNYEIEYVRLHALALATPLTFGRLRMQAAWEGSRSCAT